MSDKIESYLEGTMADGSLAQRTWEDMGDSTHAPRVINNCVKSSRTSTSQYSNSSISSLITAVNSHLSSSAGRLHSVNFFVMATTFYAVITEIDA